MFLTLINNVCSLQNLKKMTPRIEMKLREKFDIFVSYQSIVLICAKHLIKLFRLLS